MCVCGVGGEGVGGAEIRKIFILVVKKSILSRSAAVRSDRFCDDANRYELGHIFVI